MKIGETIREVRKEKRLTLKDVASMAGVAPSLISQIENDKANPSLSTLIAISHALNVSLMSLFGKEDRSQYPVVRSTERTMVMERHGSRFYSLTNKMEGDLEFLYCEYDKGGESSEHPYTHEGAEALYVLQGKLEVELSGTKYILNPGDSISFNSTEPHIARNLYDGITAAITVNSPPTF